MDNTVDQTLLRRTLVNARRTLLDARTEDGIWCGKLSSSPLATAVAVFALHQVDPEHHHNYIDRGLKWLAEAQQSDGSWGDAETLDPGNLSTTLLCYAAFVAVDRTSFAAVIERAEAWIIQRTGQLEPEKISEAVYGSYGRDRTFAVPILTMCAMAGVLGPDGWRFVKPLPFELAALPRGLFRWLKLSVVSYALPALIAIGQVKYGFNPPANPAIRLIRNLLKAPTLKRLLKIQPSNGGFLEATPLTAFVVMSMAAMGYKNHPVVVNGVDFIQRSMRSDGSWPIDTNLATWMTSLSVVALNGAEGETTLSGWEEQAICDWYRTQQFCEVHPYTGARPGGWGWTNLPGSVPDADDTAGVLVALHGLGVRGEAIRPAVKSGIRWLLNIQNSDGGIPTFCRGWGRLEFDRSCPDITAHAVTAWHLWQNKVADAFLQKKMWHAIDRALRYLSAVQRSDGAWLPLWFGNPFSQEKTNSVYGTAKVLHTLSMFNESQYLTMIEKAVAFLLAAQNDDGGWGAQKGTVSTIEESALAIHALSAFRSTGVDEPLNRGLRWLIEYTQEGTVFPAAPVGLYFAKLWYAERLYPIIFTLQAIQHAV
jgi:squalene-hopene/tetraprenyl-beta-curcumene cyclase